MEQMTNSTAGMPDEELQLVPMHKLSEHIGIKISDSQWRKWVRKENLPHISIGQTRFFNPIAVKRWLNAKAFGAQTAQPQA